MSDDKTNSQASTFAPWNFEPGTRVWLGGHDIHTRRIIEKYLAGALRPPTGPIDAALIAPKILDEALYFACKLRDRVVAKGIFWIIIPNPGSTKVDAFPGTGKTLVKAMLVLDFADAGSLPIGAEHSAYGFRDRIGPGQSCAPMESPSS